SSASPAVSPAMANAIASTACGSGCIGTDSPCRYAFLLDFARPAAVRGPVLLWALALLAAICLSLAMAFILRPMCDSSGIVGLNVSQPMTDGCYRNTPGIVQDEAEIREGLAVKAAATHPGCRQKEQESCSERTGFPSPKERH